MARHLDADVAAFVDGQLSPEATAAATRHVRDCDRCRSAVAQQQLLKHRMRSSADVTPPSSLLAALASMPADPPQPAPWWRTLARSPLWGATGVVVSASLLVAVAAYVMGAPTRADGDAVVPPFDQYVAQFWGEELGAGTASAVSASSNSPSDAVATATVMSPTDMADLTENGWPCHGRLGDDLERVQGVLQAEGAVTVSYTDGTDRLVLNEQTGALDGESLEGFQQRTLRHHPVWMRDDGVARLVTWDVDGVVYTVVTDVDDARLSAALADLPAAPAPPRLVDRMGSGVARMAGWISF